MSQFAVGESSAGNYLVEGLIKNPAWIGTHSFKIVSRNGISDQESTRGDKGLFGAAESEVFTFEIKHPCTKTVFDDWILEPVQVSLKADSKSVTLTEPKDQVSLDYGDKDGFTLCGARSLSIVTPASEFESFLTFESPDKLIIAATLKQDLGPHSVTLRVALDDYPDILPSETVLSINIGACQIKSLSATQVPAQIYQLFQEAKEFSFEPFVQYPDCSYQLDYTTRIKNIETDTYSDLPLFMTHKNLTFRAESSRIEDLGEYVVSIVPKISDIE